jgi:Na+-transporting methylmalonyl-CoA/oxaloacetate decarboxylase gamma subunit
MGPFGYVIIVLVVLIGAISGIARFEYGRVQTLTAETGTLKAQVTADGTAFDQEKTTAQTYAAAAAKWESECAPAAETTGQVAAIATLNAQLATARQRLAAAETQDEKLPACSALLASNLGSVCPDLTGGLRQLSGAPNPVRGQGGIGAGPGGAAAAGGAH